MTGLPPAVHAARKLRGATSLPEVLLWRSLRGSPAKFRRQHPIGDYIVDFYCAAAKRALEIDGWAQSAGNPARDETRDAWLVARGVRVVRIVATDILANPPAVAASIIALATAILPAGGEAARSAGGGGGREADVPGHGPPQSAFGCRLPANGEDRARALAQGTSPCR